MNLADLPHFTLSLERGHNRGIAADVIADTLAGLTVARSHARITSNIDRLWRPPSFPFLRPGMYACAPRSGCPTGRANQATTAQDAR